MATSLSSRHSAHLHAAVTRAAAPAEAVRRVRRRPAPSGPVTTTRRGRGASYRASCPVVVVRGDRAGPAGAHERILFGAKDPGTSGEAVRFAFREAEVRGCELDVVRARRRPTYVNADHSVRAADPARQYEGQALALLDALVAETAAGHPAVRVRRAAVEGPARKVLVHRSAAADLAVVGARRRSGHFGLQLGRVSHTLLHHAACPVAVVPQEA